MGSIRERDGGLLEMRVSLGTDANGKRVRKSVYGKTQREVIQAARKLQQDWEEGRLTSSDTTTVARYVETWLEHKRFEVEPRTHDNYVKDAERYILPRLGSELLGGPRGLTTARVKKFQLAIAKQHGAYTANRARSLLGNLLNDAVQEGLLHVNVADRVKPLKHEKKRIEIWTAREIRLALDAARATRWHNIIYVALSTGMRHGEITGLRRSRITLYPDSQLRPDEDHGEIRIDTGVIRINGKYRLGNPKTKYSVRTIGITRETKEILLEQLEMLRIEEIETDLVFPTRNGTIIDGTNTNTALDRVIARANSRVRAWIDERTTELQAASLSRAHAARQAAALLEAQPELRAGLEDVKRITFHDLRHTFASMMIAQGIDVVRLARILGHRDPGFTLKTYAHFFERQNRPSMPGLSPLIGDGNE